MVERRPTLLDRAHQLVYRVGYRVVRQWWRLRRPRTQGAFVCVWCGTRLLVLQNSYVDYRSFPGGGIDAGETPLAAACRELREEVGIVMEASALQHSVTVDQRLEGKRDTVWVYEVDVEVEPPIIIDHREVIHAAFVEAEEVLQGRLFPPFRGYIERRLAEVPTRRPA
ncbi:MAG: NUDIX hydrolase [Myxococcota bacterium]